MTAYFRPRRPLFAAAAVGALACATCASQAFAQDQAPVTTARASAGDGGADAAAQPAPGASVA